MKELTLTEKKKMASMKKILSDALHYFEKNGYYNTSIDKLCEEAMISKSTFFNYFGSKENVIALIEEDGIEDYREFADKQIKESDDALSIFKEVTEFQIDATVKYKNITKVFYQSAYQQERLAEIKKIQEEDTAELIEKLFDKEKYTFKMDVDIIASMVSGIFLNTVMTEPASEWKRIIMKEIKCLLDIAVIKK